MNVRRLSDYCRADRDFFDSLERIRDDDTRYAQPTEFDDAVWRRTQERGWVVLRPAHVQIPSQGWKIHVSTTPPDAAKVLDHTWRYCVERLIAFKFLRSEAFLLVMNDKNAPRQSSGKFITIYPRDHREFETTLSELGELLAPFPGPYVLSDLRYREGPLYVRYGAFKTSWCTTDTGERVPAITRPDGTAVPDVRGASFTVPDWVELPPILSPDLAARHSQITEDFPYRIDRAIQFSNSGGVYAATDQRTGEPVIVREARPFAGLDPRHRDAVWRLEREREALERLAGLGCVPRLLDYRVVRDHHYLVAEHIEGHTLLDAMLVRCPLVDPDVSEAERAEYIGWTEHVMAEVEAALALVHERGLSYGDLHPSNILIRPDGTVAFVDFELAADLAEQSRPVMAAAGFAAPGSLTGAAVDRHALERIRLMMLLPLTSLIERQPAKATTLVEAACGLLPVGARTVQRLRRGLVTQADPAAARFDDLARQYPAIKESMVAAIQASATVDRTDRLFPGDPAQFATGGLDLANGAAGVLYALHRTGTTVADEHVEWLAVRALAVSSPPAGLYTGLHGVAVTLDLLGRRGEALDVLARAGTGRRCAATADLRGGLAGVALAQLHFWRRTGDPWLLDTATAIAHRLDSAITQEQEPSGTGPRLPGLPGLMRGATGVAALFLSLFEQTADSTYLDAAERCLRRDLAQCVTRRPGTLYVLDGSRNLPYLDTGSLGLAAILSRYLRHRENDRFAEAVAAVRRSCDVPMVYLSGLQQGRAGLILGLAAIGDPRDRAAITGHTRRLGWHAINHRDGIGFPGAHLLRLSTDLFTGTAGVLLALYAACEEGGTFLPLLEPYEPVDTHPDQPRKEVKPMSNPLDLQDLPEENDAPEQGGADRCVSTVSTCEV